MFRKSLKERLSTNPSFLRRNTVSTEVVDVNVFSIKFDQRRSENHILHSRKRGRDEASFGSESIDQQLRGKKYL